MSEHRLIWLALGLVVGALLGLAIPRPARYTPLSNPGAILVMDTKTGQVWELSTSDRLSHAKWTAAPALPRSGSAQRDEGEKTESPATNPAESVEAPSAPAKPEQPVPPPPPGQVPPPPRGKVPPAPAWQAPPAPPPTRR